MAFPKAALPTVPAPDLEYIDEVAVASVINIPVRTLQGWRVLGKGPPYRKFGTAVRYSVRSLREYVESLPEGGAGIPASAISRRASQ